MRRIAKAFLSFAVIFSMLAALLPQTVAADVPSMKFGTMSFTSTMGEARTLTDSYYYSDDWFGEDPGVRNDSLALMSMQLVAGAVEGADGNGTGLLSELGFTETGFNGFGENDPDGFNYIWGRKQINAGGEDCTLVAVVVQSYSLDKEVKKAGWMQNFHVNGEEPTAEHYAFQKAVNKMIDSVAGLSGSGSVKYWIMGQSRGGALTSLLASELPEKLSGVNKGIYAYTFEAPAVIEAEAASGRDLGYIHNYICSDDPVPMLPPWGMVRLGEDFILNTAEVDAKLAEELEKLGSEGTYIAQSYSADTVQAMVRDLLGALTTQIAGRSDYSETKTDTFSAEEGGEISVSYVYQDLFMKLMGIIFGDGLGDFDAASLLDRIDALAPSIVTLAKAVSENSNADYYAAAKGLGGFLASAGLNLPLTVEDLYVLLKLAGPKLVDASYDPEIVPGENPNYVGYLMPTIMLGMSLNSLTFSHHFDTLIARLKALAPAPAIDGLDVIIPEPAAGDAATLAPEAAADYVKSLGNDWMSIEAGWEEAGETLPDNRVSYFDMTLSIVGPDVAEDFAFTLNGAEPVAPVSITYENGTSRISGTWAFTFGNPGTVTVSFDTAGHAETPESVIVNAGSQLKHVLIPERYDMVTDQDATWKFVEWLTEDGQVWDTLTAESDIVLHAKWYRVIDTVDITIPIPHVGEPFKKPTVRDGCGYHVDEVSFLTEDYDDAPETVADAVYIVSFRLFTDSDDTRFIHDFEDPDASDFSGTTFINGKEEEVNTYEGYYTYVGSGDEGRYLNVTYYVLPLPKEEGHTHELTLVPAEKESCVKDGRKEHYICAGCGKLFADPNGENEVTEEDLVIKAAGHSFGEWTTVKAPTETGTGTAERICTECGEVERKVLERVTPAAPTEYSIVSGANAGWTKGSTSPVVITVKRSADDASCFSHFTELRIDNAIVPPANYEAKSGSTVITLKTSYLETLSAGTHAVLVNFDDGKAETTLTVRAAGSASAVTPVPSTKPAPSTALAASQANKPASPAKGSPSTGDSSNPILWIVILVAAAGALIGLNRFGKKK